MSEIELAERCAQAMGWRTSRVSNKVFYCPDEQTSVLKSIWNPLKDDFQAMAMVKKFGMELWYGPASKVWSASIPDSDFDAESDDLNRTIVECVAKTRPSLDAAPHEGDK